MRILFLITRAHEGGAQEHVLNLVRGLSHEHELLLATGESGYLTEEVARMNVAVHLVPGLTTPIRPWKDFLAYTNIHRLLDRIRPDIVHTHSYKCGLLGRLAARRCGIPSIFTAHGWAFTDGAPWTRKLLAAPSEWLMAKSTDRIITVSDADFQLGLRYGIARSPRMVKVLNGVEFHPAKNRTECRRVPRIAMVARFDEPKEQVLLIRAVREISLPYELWLIGDGSARSRAEAEARSLGLSDRVRFFGTRRDVPELLEQADVFVLTSKYEGLPMSVLEAMRAGLPVVASDVGGVREAVEDSSTGFLVPRSNEQLLRDKLQDLLRDPELRHSMGNRARERFERQFTSQTMVEQTRDVYERIRSRAESNGSLYPGVGHTETDARPASRWGLY